MLTTTPLVNKVKLITRKSNGQEEYSPAFAYRGNLDFACMCVCGYPCGLLKHGGINQSITCVDGVPLEDHVEMAQLEEQLVKERNLTNVCKRRITTIRKELDKSVRKLNSKT